MFSDNLVLLFQDQFIFIHDATFESVTCGDTQVIPTNLHSTIQQLKKTDSDTGETGFYKQFYVILMCWYTFSEMCPLRHR